MAFGFDLTPYLTEGAGENVIAVKTDNRWDYGEKATGSRYHWNNGNFYANYGGISKSVWLHLTGPVYQTLPLFSNLGTTGTYIWAKDFDLSGHRARIVAESQVRNESDAEKTVLFGVEIIDLDGATRARFKAPTAAIGPKETRVLTADAQVEKLHFWSWGYGYLYDVVTTLEIDGKVVDRVTTRTGFRSTAFEHGMVYLNGRVIQMHGYAQRTTNEWPAVGLSVPPWMSDFSNRLMVESNGNLVRWMHVTPWKQDVESSDRVGLIESMPAGDAEGDSKGRQWEQRVELMRDSIIYNRNNPSILFYECGNKGITEAHMMEMKKVRDQYDPHGGRAIGAREMLASHGAEYGGEMLYINKSASKPLWAHEFNRDEGARKFLDNETPPFHKDSPLYNRNQDSFTLEDIVRWDDYYEARPGTGTRVSSGGVNIIWSDSNTHFRGDNNYRRSGEVDAMRLPKDAFYAHQVMWDGWVDVEHPRIHIVGHWNYTTGASKPVSVVSSAEKVELKLNGVSLGFGVRSHRFLFFFPAVSYEPGTLEAVGFTDGKIVASDRVVTVGPSASLKLTLHTGPKGLRADGQDIALVDVEVVDKDGLRCPTALNLIHFKLDGPAEWRGGIAQGSSTPVPRTTAPNDNHGLAATPPTPLLHEDNYILSKDLPVEAGINRVSVRSLPESGLVTLEANADGLPAAHLEFTSKAIVTQNGLSSDFPAEDQPVNLERGPTPATPSFIRRRFSIPIVSATAGANAASAALSFDDNETTSWSNAPDKVTDGLPPRGGEVAAPAASPKGGTLDTAWIEYTFAHATQPTELEMKLNGFRQRRYPIRVTLDGTIVYEGLTPATLGYCNLKLRPATGQHLRIALTAPPVNTSENNAIVEITGKIEGSGNKPLGGTGDPIISVIEAEVYSAAP
jgi:beta-galactosidase